MKTVLRCMTAMYLLISVFTMLHAQNHSLLGDITPGNDTTKPWISRDVEAGFMYFRTIDYSGNPAIWRTDGSVAATSRFADVSAMGMIRAINGVVYFQSMPDPVNGTEPWRSDGTASGTFMLADMNPRSANSYPRDFTAFGGAVYFRTSYYKRKNGSPYPQDYNWELWKTDGTTTGTVKTGSMPYHMDLTSTGSVLVLDGIDLNASSGAGVSEIADVCPTFPADWYAPCITEPYAGWPVVYRDTRRPVEVNGIVYLTLFNPSSGGELWRSDGTPSGTWQCTDINPGPGSSYPSFLIAMGAYLYFAAYSPGSGTELWRYPLNGTSYTQAERVFDIVPGSGSSEPMWLTVLDDVLYFSAWRELDGRELWMSDGIPSGTTALVMDIYPGPQSSDPQYTSVEYDGGGDGDKKFNRSFAVSGEKLYFAATEPVHGYELWSSNGSPAGTVLAADIYPGTGNSWVRGLTVVNGRILLNAYEPNAGWEWWVYETGANLPPVAVATANPTQGVSPLLVVFNGSGSYDPEDGNNIVYHWDFGDGSAPSSAMNPSHTYTNPGSYSAVLTITDPANATGTDQVTVTVTVAPSGYVYVAAQSVTRVPFPGNKIAAEDLVLIRDENDQPVAGAVVTADYLGASTGSAVGTTDEHGEVTLESSRVRNPVGVWCFEITGVQAAGKTYNPSANIVTSQCEPSPKVNAQQAMSCILHQNLPNPFCTQTVISFTLPHDMEMSMIVTDALGRLVRRLVNRSILGVGTHSVLFDAQDLPSGVYICRVESETMVLVQRMVLLK